MKKHLFWIIFFLIISACCVFFITTRKPGNTAIIKSDGKVIKTVDLNTVTTPYEYTVEYNGHKNTVLIEHGRISVIDADCPDKLCIKQGYTGDIPVVCLPNHLSISVTSENIDAVTG